METKKKLCLVDDHVVVRNGIKELIEKLGPYEVSEEYSDGKEFMDSLQNGHRPDLVLLDLSMPNMSGLEVMRQLSNIGNPCPVLILSLNEDEDQILHLFRLGARGYLTKNSSAETVRKALENVFTSGYHHNEFMQLSIEGRGRKHPSNGPLFILEKISSREREFLKLVCDPDELTYEQIADRMKINTRTVDGYRESLFQKFSIRSKTGLVLFVLKYKLYDYL